MSTPDFDGITHHDAEAQDTTLRDRMATRIFDAVEISAGCDCVVAVRSYDAVDDIIALVREALLSDAAVMAATRTVAIEVAPGNVFFGPDADIMREAITASLDAAGIGEATP